MTAANGSIRAITNDFWNTIVDSGNGAGRHQYRIDAIQHVLRKLTLERSDDAIGLSIRQIHPIFDRIWKNEQRTPRTSELVHEIWKILKVHPPGELHRFVVGKFEDSILHAPPALLPDTKKIIASLARSYRLALISDTAFSPGHILTKLLEAYGLKQYFHVLIFSDETGVSKPHRRAFESALLTLETTPEYGLHIGDIEWTDVKGAKDIGMKAILFRGDKSAMSYANDISGTNADAVAHGWNEIPGIIASWNGV